MKVAVGSKNPAKLEAVKIAFQRVWPEESWVVEGVTVSSGVSNQPMSDSESIQGARNRASQAIKVLDGDFGVGLEGGMQQVDEQYFNCGWVVVLNKKSEEGIGSSAKMIVPEKVLNLVKAGKELGTACDVIFNVSNSKHDTGYTGLMTDNRVTRTQGFVEGVTMALARFIHPELF